MSTNYLSALLHNFVIIIHPCKQLLPASVAVVQNLCKVALLHRSKQVHHIRLNPPFKTMIIVFLADCRVHTLATVLNMTIPTSPLLMPLSPFFIRDHFSRPMLFTWLNNPCSLLQSAPFFRVSAYCPYRCPLQFSFSKTHGTTDPTYALTLT